MFLQKITLSEVAVFVNTSQKILVWLECTKRSVELKVYACGVEKYCSQGMTTDLVDVS